MMNKWCTYQSTLSFTWFMATFLLSLKSSGTVDSARDWYATVFFAPVVFCESHHEIRSKWEKIQPLTSLCFFPQSNLRTSSRAIPLTRTHINALLLAAHLMVGGPGFFFGVAVRSDMRERRIKNDDGSVTRESEMNGWMERGRTGQGKDIAVQARLTRGDSVFRISFLGSGSSSDE